MNRDNITQIFSHYIDNFERLNGDKIREYFKWQACYEFKPLMDKALAADDSHFSAALYEVKKCTHIIIDTYTQPFYGLVKMAEKEPGTVRQMFLNLYADDGGDIYVQMKKISDFFSASNELLEKYYPGSHLYKQNSHSVSSYLFLYDPDHHYLYKATQSYVMADCIEFYDEWGSGDNIKLDIYYRMCDEIVEEIKKCPELLATNRSRYDGRVRIKGGPLHEDRELHILTFDIIWCCHVHNLFKGISFNRPKSKEKQLIIEQRNKAQELLERYENAVANREKLNETLEYFSTAVRPGDSVVHKKNGRSVVISIDRDRLAIKCDNLEKNTVLGLATVISNGIIRYETEDFSQKLEEYQAVLKRIDSIEKEVEYSERALEPYKGYLE